MFIKQIEFYIYNVGIIGIIFIMSILLCKSTVIFWREIYIGNVIKFDFTTFTVIHTCLIFDAFFPFDETVIPRVLKPGSR